MRTIAFFSILFGLMLLITGCVPPDIPTEPSTFTATFTVLDETENPIRGASIQHPEFGSTTDDRGLAIISGLDSSKSYRFTVNADNFEASRVLVNADSTQVSLNLEKIEEDLKVLEHTLNFNLRKNYNFDDMSYYYEKKIDGTSFWSGASHANMVIKCSWQDSDGNEERTRSSVIADEQNNRLRFSHSQFSEDIDIASPVSCVSDLFFREHEQISKTFNRDVLSPPKILRADLLKNVTDEGSFLSIIIDVENLNGGVCTVQYIVRSRSENFMYVNIKEFDDCPESVEIREVLEDFDVSETQFFVSATSPERLQVSSAGSGVFYFDSVDEDDDGVFVSSSVEESVSSMEEHAEELDSFFKE